jgi:hypothetical protein
MYLLLRLLACFRSILGVVQMVAYVLCVPGLLLGWIVGGLRNYTEGIEARVRMASAPSRSPEAWAQAHYDWMCAHPEVQDRTGVAESLQYVRRVSRAWGSPLKRWCPSDWERWERRVWELWEQNQVDALRSPSHWKDTQELLKACPPPSVVIPVTRTIHHEPPPTSP